MGDGFLTRLHHRRQSWILFTLLRKPSSTRDAIERGLVATAVAAALAAPLFIGGRGGDAAEGASEAFSAQLAELAQLREQRDADGGSAEIDKRIAALETATELGYLKRDGDASDRGALVPDFRLLDLDGNPQRLSEIAGPIVLNFWASWCGPCIEEMPEFEIISRETAGRVTFIGVNDGEDLATAREFAYEVTNVSYMILLDPTKSMTDGPYQLVGRPTTFFIGDDGNIKELRVGIVRLDDLRDLVSELLGEELGASEEPIPADYGEAVLNIIESAKANYSAADVEIDRWRANPSVFGDPGWQRNLTAQVQVWSDLHKQYSALAPPAQWEDLHRTVGDALAQIANAAGPLVRSAIEGSVEGDLEIGVGLLGTFRAAFDAAAENLAGVIATQQ